MAEKQIQMDDGPNSPLSIVTEDGDPMVDAGDDGDSKSDGEDDEPSNFWNAEIGSPRKSRKSGKPGNKSVAGQTLHPAISALKDDPDNDKWFWDYCMVFNKGGDDEIEVPDDPDAVKHMATKAGAKKSEPSSLKDRLLGNPGTTKQQPEHEYFAKQTSIMIDQLVDAGLCVKAYLSVQRDELYVLIGGSEARLKFEADRTGYILKFDEDRLFDYAAHTMKPANRLAEKTLEKEQGTDDEKEFTRYCYRTNWENMYGPYKRGGDGRDEEERQRTEDLQVVYRRYDEEDNLTDNVEKDSLFRTADRLRLTMSIMEAEHEVGGAEISIADAISKHPHNPLCACFPLHQEEKKVKLLDKWKPTLYFWREQPLDEIRDYFGEKIALYFAFLGHFTQWLFWPSILGIGYTIGQIIVGSPDVDSVAVVGILTSVWAVLFLEYWKRKEANLRVRWGMTEFTNTEQPRPQFHGEWIADSINGKKIEYYPAKLRRKYTIIGGMGVIVLLIAVLGTIVGMFVFRNRLANNEVNGLDANNGAILVSVINAIQIQVFNFLYGIIAEKLTDMENHQTDSEYEDALIAKSFVFKFINSYNALYYIAFIKAFNEGCVDADNELSDDPKDCFDELRTQIGVVFATIIFMNNTIEFMGPVISNYFKQREDMKGVADDVKPTPAELQKNKAIYSTFPDFDELIIEFGFVTLFIVALPITPILAVINNVLEIYLDSHRMSNSCQRPEPKGASTIGSWKTIIEIMCFITVITNLGMIVFVASDVDKIVGEPDSDFQKGATMVAVFFVLEHILLFSKIALDVLIPDENGKDSKHEARQKYIVNAVINNRPDGPDADIYEKLFNADQSDARPLNWGKIPVGLDSGHGKHTIPTD